MHSLKSSRVFYSKEHKSGAEKSVGTRNEVLYDAPSFLLHESNLVYI